MKAYANPTRNNHNAAGFGIVRFDKENRTVTMECWPRHADVTDPSTKQFAGWPIKVSQQDNYHREPIAHLPTLKIRGAVNPVIQVIDEYLDEIVYTIRIKGVQWRPEVFKEGVYTVKIMDGDHEKVIKNIKSIPAESTESLQIEM